MRISDWSSDVCSSDLRPHEFGATIEPKKQWLTIPIYHALRVDGTPKFANPTSWKRFGSFIWTRKTDGKKFVVYKSKQNRELKFLYVLVDHMELKPQFGLIRRDTDIMTRLMSIWWSRYGSSVGKDVVSKLNT